MLQKELSKYHASKKTVKIPCFKNNCRKSMLQEKLSKLNAYKELSKFNASKRTVKIPCFKKNCQNTILQKELSKFYTKFKSKPPRSHESPK
jgi:hypothetical protein